eukprot:CAMPEP_0170453904 /NCGR_PEP_ID=MMETSP0123-20130129/2342_1 /TAXON_ID=182087 /ORGANISM="Favella ehrenbergii, Strain Fehren 1" /LENGTH=122 /DNA_ID=CAMNT_0010716455 /DNA_START=1 /DNA_END=369 /DNA_ORIENTATION=-
MIRDDSTDRSNDMKREQQHSEKSSSRRKHTRRGKKVKPMSDLDVIVTHCVKRLWHRFDADNSGSLDRQEARRMLQSSSVGFGLARHLEEEDFDKMFDELDENSNGLIERHEMVTMLRLVLGI